jgi:hypothetical protein
MQFSEVIQGHLRNVALHSTHLVHWTDGGSLTRNRLSDLQILEELLQPVCLVTGRKLVHPLMRRLLTCSRAGDQACRCHLPHLDLHQAARDRRVWDLVMIRIACLVIRRLHQHGDQARARSGQSHQPLWDGRMSRLQPLLQPHVQLQQDHQRLTAYTLTRVPKLGATRSMLRRLQKRRANQQYLGHRRLHTQVARFPGHLDAKGVLEEASGNVEKRVVLHVNDGLNRATTHGLKI